MKALTYVEIDVPQFVLDVDFATDYIFVPSTLAGWTAESATATATAIGATFVPTGADPIFLSAAAQSINGATNRYLTIDIERTAVRTVGTWQGQVYYTTAGHSFSESYTKFFAELPNYVGARRTYVLDMNDLDFGDDDWEISTITRLRLDFEHGSPNGSFLIRSVRLGLLTDPYPTETFRFSMPSAYLPKDIEAIPSIESVSFTPAMISLGKNLGQRASLNISFKDHKHIFDGEPFDQGTFWGKWRGRYGTKLRGRDVRLIRGFVGQTIEQMDTRHYIIDTTDGPTFSATYQFSAKDLLKVADDDRAQAPILSNGRLAGSINISQTSATLSPAGIGNSEYPASGWVCIGGNEIVSFTRSSDTLTIVRAQLGSAASAHDSGDRVQLVLRYTGNDPADIIYELLTDYAGVDPARIDLPAWQTETANYLGVIYAATITEPTSVKTLVSELIEQAALAVWWDDQARQLRLQVLREISTDADTFDAGRIIAGSFSVKEQPTKRISQIWTYYGQRDPTDSGANEDNYRAALASVDLVLEAEYGSAEIRKILARWVETETAATRFNSIQLSRFRDPPRAFGFDLFSGESIVLAGGYQLAWWGNQDETGAEIPALIQVTQITIYPDRLHIEAEEMLASGVIVLVNVVFLTTTGSLLDFVVPATWNSSDNTVETIGGGGNGGFNGGVGCKGGGAGGYSGITNLTLTPLATVKYQVGAIAGDTWFNGTTLALSSVGAKGGSTGIDRTGGGVGGLASGGVGTTKFSGGNGGDGGNSDDNPEGAGGGGGAAGPHGNGANGGAGGPNTRNGGGGGGADGGSVGGIGDSGVQVGGNNRFGFGGGPINGAGSEGGGGGGGDSLDNGGPSDAEQLWTQTIAPIISAGPSGGGGGAGSQAAGGASTNYGGGGGGGSQGGAAGPGGQGLIVLSWRQ